MARKNTVNQVTELVTGLAKLAFIALGATLAFVTVLLLGNVALYLLGHVCDTLFDLIKAVFGS